MEEEEYELKHLFIARHGNPIDFEGNLFPDSQRELEGLGKRINEILSGGDAYILTSPQPRAVNSARVLAAQLRLVDEVEKVDSLDEYGDFHGGSLDEVIEKYKQKTDGLIIIAHQPFIAGCLPVSRFMGKFNGRIYVLEDLKKAEAVHFDLDRRTYSKV